MNYKFPPKKNGLKLVGEMWPWESGNFQFLWQIQLGQDLYIFGAPNLFSIRVER